MNIERNTTIEPCPEEEKNEVYREAAREVSVVQIGNSWENLARRNFVFTFGMQK